MPSVEPTELWHQSPRRLIVPNMGIVDYPRAGAIAVTDDVAAWLLAEGYANQVEEQSQAKNQTPPAGKQEQGQTQDTGETHAIELEAWQVQTLEFLNSTEPEEIAKQIKGIGNKTAEDLEKARPLDWTKLDEVLNASQINALKSHFS